MKKIAIATNSDLTNDSRTINICQSLHRNGYDVTLVGRSLPGSPPLPSVDFKTHRIKCFFSKGSNFYREYNYRLSSYLKKLGANKYGAINYDTLKAVNQAAKARSANMFIDIQDWYEEMEEHAKQKIKWVKIAQEYIPKNSFCITTSTGLADKLKERYGQTFNTILSAPLLEEKEPGSIRDEILVYIGELKEGRGLPEIVKAMHDIDAKLMLIGEGAMKEALWTLATKENLLHKVIFKDDMSADDLPELLLKARVGINLLDKSSDNNKYSLNSTFFQYIHAGMPQVFMDMPEYHRLYQEYRVGASTYDLKQTSLVYAVNHLLQDRNYWFNIHVDCLKARQAWNWQKEEKKLLDLIEKM